MQASWLRKSFDSLKPPLLSTLILRVSYDLFKEALLKTGYFVDGMGTHFTAGFMAGTVATTM